MTTPRKTAKKPATRKAKKPRITLAALARKVDDNENGVSQHRAWAERQAQRIDGLSGAVGALRSDLASTIQRVSRLQLHDAQISERSNTMQAAKPSGEIQQIKEQLHRLDLILEGLGMNKPPAGSVADRLKAMDKAIDTEKAHRQEDFKRLGQLMVEGDNELLRRVEALESDKTLRKATIPLRVSDEVQAAQGEVLRGGRWKAIERVSSAPRSYELLIDEHKMAGLKAGESFRMDGPEALVRVTYLPGMEGYQITIDPCPFNDNAPKPPESPQASAEPKAA